MTGTTSIFKEEIIEDMQFIKGKLPFKYLGVPLLAIKLIIQQCMPLVKKIMKKNRCWSTKMLSYSGRVQLIKNVLFEI